MLRLSKHWAGFFSNLLGRLGRLPDGYRSLPGG